MIINAIKLNNFGSYEGENSFQTQIKGKKNIVIFGGKNGAGKTTLFTAIRVCLYGYASMGYKSKNSYYFKAISKLLNNTAKINKPTTAYVSLEVAITNENEENVFELTRSWILNDSLTEKFCVKKNGGFLDDEEIANFEKYILNVLPPELFNLYFFDGEKIADFFMEENSGQRIKNAFLTLCGYDVFDIMKTNFKRLGTNSAGETQLLDEYMKGKDELAKQEELLSELNALYEKCSEIIITCDLNLEMIEKDFIDKGGISEDDWVKKIEVLKDEENKRTILNHNIKKWANEIVPFLILKDKMMELETQIKLENECQKAIHFIEVINEENIQDLLNKELGDRTNKFMSKINGYVTKQYGNATAPILALSMEQMININNNINKMKTFDANQIEDSKKEIKESIKYAAAVRVELEHSSTHSSQEFLEKKNNLLVEKNKALEQQNSLKVQLIENETKLDQTRHDFEIKKKKIEEEIKKRSISDISAKSILMLDNLQDVLYHKQIKKVEKNFKKIMNTLMYKTDFIDNIRIDDDFNIHIYRYESIESKKAIKYIENRTLEEAETVIGSAAIEFLCALTKTKDVNKMRQILQNEAGLMMIPIEIDKSSLSNGEKQIFIMALYYSMMEISNQEIPFIIDTPFARIDAQHRRNISRYFFSELKGQVFILSTDEEINESHMKIMKDRIATTYMLENLDNKKTIIHNNKYFEV